MAPDRPPSPLAESPLPPGQLRRVRLDILASSVPRRWTLLVIGGALLWTAGRFGVADVQFIQLLGFLSVTGVMNFGIGYLTHYQWDHRWLVPGLAVLDSLIVGSIAAVIGPGIVGAVILIAVIPYAMQETRAAGDWYLIMAAVVYMAAVLLHGQVFATRPFGITNIPALAYVEAASVVLAGILLRRHLANLIRRIRHDGALMRHAQLGALSVRAPTDREDELGLLETSFNRMLDELANTISTVQREADEVAVLAEVLSQSAEGVLASSDAVAATAVALAKEMALQRDRAEIGYRHSSEAAGEAGGLRDRAESVAEDALQLVESARASRERVQRAGETLLAIGEDVRSTASTARVLGDMSERIGRFAHAISRIARQTHVLALNAAIEAAHSGDDTVGFSAVADEVRVLAAAASDSARDVAAVIDDVQSRIDAVSRAMGAGQAMVTDVGVVAGEAQAALDDLSRRVAQVTSLVNATAEISKVQAQRMKTLAEKMSEIAATSARSSEEASGAASAMSVQKTTIEDLNAISQQLASVADRVRGSVARFTVLPGGPPTPKATHRADPKPSHDRTP